MFPNESLLYLLIVEAKEFITWCLYNALRANVSCFIEQNFDPIRHMLEHIPDEGVNQGYFDNKVHSRCNLLLVC